MEVKKDTTPASETWERRLRQKDGCVNLGGGGKHYRINAIIDSTIEIVDMMAA